MHILGIDVGGTGIKAAPVNLENGTLETSPLILPTPLRPTPDQVAAIIKKIIHHFQWIGQVGCGVPVVIHKGKAVTNGGHMNKNWIGVQIDELFEKETRLPFTLSNDADAAGLAEMTYGAGIGKKGLVMMVTIGTGLGTGVFFNGQLLPNFELGRLLYTNGEPIELYAAGPSIKRENLDLISWGKRFNEFLEHLNYLFSPEHFILGGGLSNEFDQFKHTLSVDTPISLSRFKSEAGILGAAILPTMREKFKIERNKESAL